MCATSTVWAKMRHLDGMLKGVRGARLYSQAWLPAAEPRALLLLAHGLGEHSGRYGNVVNAVVPRGYGVYALDHLGHGRSEGTRKHVERFTDFTEPVRTYSRLLADRHPGKPVFLVGHSMGGLIVAVHLLEHQADFRGAVLSAPAVAVDRSVSAATVAVGKVLALVAPKVGILGLDINGISRDPAVVRAALADPLNYQGKMTARLGAELLNAIQRLAREAGKIRLPLLVLQGTDDRLVAPVGAQMLYDKVSSPDKTLRIYPGLYHELFNEPEHAEVIEEVLGWLEARTM